MAGITSTGLGSGLDIKNIVTSIVGAEKDPALSSMMAESGKATAAISAYGLLNSQLGDFKDSYSALARKSTFSAAAATSSDPSILDVSIGIGAEVGDWTFEVQQQAKAQTITSTSANSYTEANSEVGTGEISFNYGTYEADGSFSVNPDQPAETLTIDASNNSLNKLRDTINDGDYSVSASIVNDGTHYRLVLINKNTGKENAMQLTVADSDGNNTDVSGLSSLTYSADVKHMERTETAQDASVIINGIRITRPSNQITSVIEGVTLNIEGESKPGSKVSLNIAKDTSKVEEQIKAFVENYNNTIAQMNALTAYGGESGDDGPLNGDSTVRNIKSQMRNILNTSVKHTEGAVQSFADLGMLTNLDGTLTLNESKLLNVIDTDMESIANFFTPSGGTSDSLINFESKNSLTSPGTYEIEVNKFATQGILVGNPFHSGNYPMTIDSDNNSFKMRLNGFLSDDIVLTSTTYNSAEQLAKEMQSKINSDPNFLQNKITASVLESNGSLNIISNRYGSESTVAITEVKDSNFFGWNLGLVVTGGINGENAQGMIGGNEASGDGQMLRSTSGKSNGLLVEVKGGDLGKRGTVTYSQGMSAMLNETLNGIIDRNISSSDGDTSVSNSTVDGKIDSLYKKIRDIGAQEESLNYRMEKLEARLYKQFNSMDSAVSGLDNLKSYLKSTLDNLPGYSNK